MKKNGYFLFILLLLSPALKAQEKLVLDGYISTMDQHTFAKDLSNNKNSLWDIVIHNRLNLTYYVNDNLTVKGAMRNQFVWGDTYGMYPNLAENLTADAGFFDLTFNLWAGNNNALTTQFDRAYFEYSKKSFELSAGRQRINWGRTFVWNPNDIFNAFSYYAVDYPERPGSDAVRAAYYLGTASRVELVSKLDSANRLTLAALYGFNVEGFDIQILSGYVNAQDYMLGTGWEGNLGPVGFRGEASYYRSEEQFSDTTGVFLASVGFDYLWGDKFTLQAEFLYNDPKTLTGIGGSNALIFLPPASPKSLSFSEYNIFGALAWQTNPLLALNLSSIYYTDYDGYFLMPSADFSITEDIYLSAIFQYFNLKVGQQRVQSNLAYVRLKWNF